jgi:ribosome-binding protein aMBF1 (putative translation factor)
MRCEICGMKIKGEPIVEEIDRKKHYYCCEDCLKYLVCTCDKYLKKFNKKWLKEENIRIHKSKRSGGTTC